MTNNEFWKAYVLANGGTRYRVEIFQHGEHVKRCYEYGTLETVRYLFESIFTAEKGYSLSYHLVQSRA